MAETGWPNVHRFDEVDRAPRGPGLYAWYHIPDISRADVDTYCVRISQAPGPEKRALVEQFLAEYIFRPYQETPYKVRIAGALKPEYSGDVSHINKFSNKMLDYLAERPEALHEIKDILSRSVPIFSSPIYIGIAKTSLRTRLSQHRLLIEQYIEQGPPISSDNDQEGHSFAREVVLIRKLDTLRLYVFTTETAIPPHTALAAEYILNRINYPLCGRN